MKSGQLTVRPQSVNDQSLAPNLMKSRPVDDLNSEFALKNVKSFKTVSQLLMQRMLRRKKDGECQLSRVASDISFAGARLSNAKRNVEELEQTAKYAERPTGQYRTHNERHEVTVEPCAMYLGYNRCQCGSTCVGSGSSSSYYVDINVPVMEPDLEARALANEKLCIERAKLDALAASTAIAVEELTVPALALRVANQKLKENADDLYAFYEFLSPFIYMYQPPLVALPFNLLARVYVLLTDVTHQVDFLELLLSLNPENQTLLSFARALANIDMEACRDLPAILFGKQSLESYNSQKLVYYYTLFLLQQDLYNDDSHLTFKSFVHIEYVKFHVLDRINQGIERLNGFFVKSNLLLSSPDAKVTALRRLHDLITDHSLRARDLADQPRSTYANVFSFWLQEQVVVNGKGERASATNAEVIASASNPIKRLGLFEQTTTATTELISELTRDYGEVRLLLR